MENYLVKIKDSHFVTIKFMMYINEGTEKYFNKIINVLDKHCIEHDINNNYNHKKVKKSTVTFRLCLSPFEGLNEIKDELIKNKEMLHLFTIDDQHTSIIMGFLSIYKYILETKNNIKLCIKDSNNPDFVKSPSRYEIITIEKRNDKFISYINYYTEDDNDAGKTNDEEITLENVFGALMIYDGWSLYNID